MNGIEDQDCFAVRMNHADALKRKGKKWGWFTVITGVFGVLFVILGLEAPFMLAIAVPFFIIMPFFWATSGEYYQDAHRESFRAYHASL